MPQRPEAVDEVDLEVDSMIVAEEEAAAEPQEEEEASVVIEDEEEEEAEALHVAEVVFLDGDPYLLDERLPSKSRILSCQMSGVNLSSVGKINF